MRTVSPPGAQAALDLGSSRVRATLPSRAMFVDRPSAVAHSPAAAGRRTARERPIEHGMVIDAGACTRLARLILLEADPRRELREVLLAVPSAAGDAQLARAVNAVQAAAGRPVRTMPAPLAAAIGAGVGPADPRPRLVLDIGAGIVETAVIMRGRVHAARSMQYVPEHRAGHRLPRIPDDLWDQVGTAIRHVLSELPAPLRRPARDAGLLLTGGGARLPSLPGGLTAEMGIPISIARDPARATIRGLAHACRSPLARDHT